MFRVYRVWGLVRSVRPYIKPERDRGYCKQQKNRPPFADDLAAILQQTGNLAMCTGASSEDKLYAI